MPKMLSTLGAVLTVAVIAVGVLVSPGLAASKKAPAPVPQTEADQSFSAGDDGGTQAGVPFPTPRFTDQHNGTVRDNLTGLIWMKQANSYGFIGWTQALGGATQGLVATGIQLTLVPNPLLRVRRGPHPLDEGGPTVRALKLQELFAGRFQLLSHAVDFLLATAHCLTVGKPFQLSIGGVR